MRAGIVSILALSCVTDAEVRRALDRDGDGFITDEVGGADCDDAAFAVFPGSAEICGDGVDNNCDGGVDDFGVGEIEWFPDADRDGFGVQALGRQACPQWAEGLSGAWSTVPGDCDDADPAIRPDAEERCDGIDNDCNEQIDDSATVATVQGLTFATVQAGLSAAIEAGAPLDVCGGTHPIQGVTLSWGESLTIRGLGTEVTELLGAPGAPLFELSGGALTLMDLAVVGASGAAAIDTSGAISPVAVSLTSCEVREAATGLRIAAVVPVSVDLVGCTVRDNGTGAPGHGGLVASDRVTLTVRNSTFVDNVGDLGGAISLSVAPGVAGLASLTIDDTTFVDNTATSGGALYVATAERNDVPFVLDTVTFMGNAATEGGALDTTAHLDLQAVTVLGNLATRGAGLALREAARVTVDAQSVVHRNTASQSGGGAWVIDDAELRVEGADFGIGADDNTPDDLVGVILGTDATVTCTAEGCE